MLMGVLSGLVTYSLERKSIVPVARSVVADAARASGCGRAAGFAFRASFSIPGVKIDPPARIHAHFLALRASLRVSTVSLGVSGFSGFRGREMIAAWAMAPIARAGIQVSELNLYYSRLRFARDG
jgi:hypothetical protein